MLKRRTLLGGSTKMLLSAIALFATAANSFAADYPDRALKLIVPWAAGGDTDLIFRPLAPLLQKYLGQPVVIANVGGASGTVGEREAASAAPDGYTIYGAHDYIHSVYFAGMIDLKYSNAFEPVCMVSSTPSVITVGAKIPWKTFKELVEDAKNVRIRSWWAPRWDRPANIRLRLRPRQLVSASNMCLTMERPSV